MQEPAPRAIHNSSSPPLVNELPSYRGLLKNVEGINGGRRRLVQRDDGAAVMTA